MIVTRMVIGMDETRLLRHFLQRPKARTEALQVVEVEILASEAYDAAIYPGGIKALKLRVGDVFHIDIESVGTGVFAKRNDLYEGAPVRCCGVACAAHQLGTAVVYRLSIIRNNDGR